MLAARAGARAEYQVASAESLPFEDGSFDVAVSRLVLHHLPGDLKLRALREMRRVLRPGGRLLVADMASPAAKGAHHLVAHLLGTHPDTEDAPRAPGLGARASGRSPPAGSCTACSLGVAARQSGERRAGVTVASRDDHAARPRARSTAPAVTTAATTRATATRTAPSTRRCSRRRRASRPSSGRWSSWRSPPRSRSPSSCSPAASRCSPTRCTTSATRSPPCRCGSPSPTRGGHRPSATPTASGASRTSPASPWC